MTKCGVILLYIYKALFLVFTDLLSINLDPGRKLKITNSDLDLTHKVIADPDRTKSLGSEPATSDFFLSYRVHFDRCLMCFGYICFDFTDQEAYLCCTDLAFRSFSAKKKEE